MVDVDVVVVDVEDVDVEDVDVEDDGLRLCCGGFLLRVG